MKCENYNINTERCNYFEALIGTDEDPPTGMDESTGECVAFKEQDDNWYMVEREDCDMFDIE